MSDAGSGGTALMVAQQQGGAMTAYNPAFANLTAATTFIQEMGKVFSQSGVGGVKTDAEGKLLAFACLAKQTDPFTLMASHHLVDGKLSMKADVMLANFRQRGGKHRWVKDGSDGEAELQLTFEGQTVTSKFSIADAKAAKIWRAGSAWDKSPANMLRARCTSNGVRMIAPEVLGGNYTPEELADVAAENAANVATTPAKTAKEVAARAAELKKEHAATVTASLATPATATTQQAPVIDAEYQAKVVIVESVEAAPFDTNPAPNVTPATAINTTEFTESVTLMGEVDQCLASLAVSREQLSQSLAGKTPGRTLDNIPLPDLRTLVANLRAAVAKKQGGAAA